MSATNPNEVDSGGEQQQYTLTDSDDRLQSSQH